MLHIALCITFYDVIVSVILAQTVRTYTKCVQVGTTSVNKNPFLESDCKSAIGGAIMCRESAQCTDFTYDDLTKTCHLYQMNDTVKCDLNEKNGGMTFYYRKRRYNGNLEWTTSGLMLLPNDTRWAPGEPKTEECVQIWAGKFDDTSCLDEKKFVCEKVSMLTILPSHNRTCN
ncbi:unnamed protein product [Mytilus edulis]|uniref:C-type lectin domain-containing protein n=1 Tax=Mytilus edulis TaxID=6550 RepID=A0A8S3SIX8_MYTED|nr:unnamed protein product [Mytilus edulis]